MARQVAVTTYSLAPFKASAGFDRAAVQLSRNPPIYCRPLSCTEQPNAPRKKTLETSAWMDNSTHHAYPGSCPWHCIPHTCSGTGAASARKRSRRCSSVAGVRGGNGRKSIWNSHLHLPDVVWACAVKSLQRLGFVCFKLHSKDCRCGANSQPRSHETCVVAISSGLSSV